MPRILMATRTEQHEKGQLMPIPVKHQTWGAKINKANPVEKVLPIVTGAGRPPGAPPQTTPSKKMFPLSAPNTR